MKAITREEIKPGMQFIAVWNYRDRLWTATLRLEQNNTLMEYTSSTDDWDEAGGTLESYETQLRASFYTI